MSEKITPDLGYIYDITDMRQNDVPDVNFLKDWDLVAAKLFCQKVAEGQLMKVAMEECQKEGHATVAQLNRWKSGYAFFREMLEIAKYERTEQFFEDIVEIADDATDDAVMGATGPMVNGKAIRRAELMINTRKFVMAKSNPTKYGDKSQMEITGKDGKDLMPTAINIQLIPHGNFLTQDEASKEREDMREGASEE